MESTESNSSVSNPRSAKSTPYCCSMNTSRAIVSTESNRPLAISESLSAKTFSSPFRRSRLCTSSRTATFSFIICCHQTTASFGRGSLSEGFTEPRPKEAVASLSRIIHQLLPQVTLSEVSSLISSFGTTILVDVELKIRVWPPGLE